MTDTPLPRQPQRLTFEDDRGASRSRWVAGLLGLLLVVWMGSGFVLPAAEDTVEKTVEAPGPVSVAVLESTARPVTKTFTAEGQAQPDRRATIRAQGTGEVIALAARKGETLDDGGEIAQLSTRELEARVVEAQEALSRAQEDFDSTLALFDDGIATATRLRETRAELATAEARLAQAEEALDAAVIRAPFAGRLDTLDIEIGSYVSAGAEIGVLLDTDPLRIVIQVPQQSLAQIREGQEATVTFITGEERSGTIEYVSRDAQSETRTFRAEIVVDNPGGAIASGLSVQVRIPTEEVTAHFVSPAILSLSEDGNLGLKTVDAEDRVVFYPVVVERAQRDGIWVSGLPDSTRIITIGQGFVSDGEIVAPIAGPDDMVSAQIDAPGETGTRVD